MFVSPPQLPFSTICCCDDIVGVFRGRVLLLLLPLLVNRIAVTGCIALPFGLFDAESDAPDTTPDTTPPPLGL